MKEKITVWIDSSFYENSNNCAWGASYNDPITGEKLNLSGMCHGIKSSTHAELAGVYACLTIIQEQFPNCTFMARIDCQSLVNLYEEPDNHKTKDLVIGRLMRRIREDFGDILEMVFVPGHRPKTDNSQDAVRNREVDKIAGKLNKAKRIA